MSKQISIVMAYHNRKPQFLRTLKSIEQSIYAKDTELVIVDDCSLEEHDLSDIKSSTLSINLIKLKKENKWYTNPCIPFNIGFKEAKGEIIIIQNPECYHVGDIVTSAVENIDNNSYLSFGCYSLNEGKTHLLQKIKYDTRELFLEQIDKFKSGLPQRQFQYLGDNGWYNHSSFRPVGYHFCAAITKENLEDLGGFDERYATGVSYDDDEFLSRIKRKGLKIKFVDEPFVFHQYHFENGSAYNAEKVERNKILYETKTLQETTYKVNLIPIINHE